MGNSVPPRVVTAFLSSSPNTDVAYTFWKDDAGTLTASELAQLVAGVVLGPTPTISGAPVGRQLAALNALPKILPA